MADQTTSYSSIAEMALRARRRSDHVNSTFVSDAEVEQYVKESYYEFYDLLIESTGPDHFVSSLEFTTEAGKGRYELVTTGAIAEDRPIDIYKTLRLSISFDGGQTFDAIQRFPFHELDRINQRSGWTSASDVGYNIVSSLNNVGLYGNVQHRTMVLAPVPTGAFQGVLYYIPTPWVSEGQAATNYILHFTHWDEYIVVDAAMKILEKEESETGHLVRRKEELRQRILWHANTMNHDDAGAVRDVSGAYGRGLRGEPWS